MPRFFMPAFDSTIIFPVEVKLLTTSFSSSRGAATPRW